MRTLENAEWDLESRRASLQCLNHVFCASGLVVHLSDTASASDLARLELVAGWLLAGCWLVAGLLLDDCWWVAGRLLAGCWLVAGSTWEGGRFLAGFWLVAGWAARSAIPEWSYSSGRNHI